MRISDDKRGVCESMNIFKRLYRAIHSIFVDIAEGNVTEDDFDLIFWTAMVVWCIFIVVMFSTFDPPLQPIGVM